MNDHEQGFMLKNSTLSLQNSKRLILLFGVVLLCIIWAGLFLKIESERKTEIEGAFKQTASFARAFEEHTLRTISGVDQVVLFLKYHYERDGRAMDIPGYFRSGAFTNNLPLVLMGVIAENGDFVLSNQVPFVPSSLKDREHFLVHKDVDSKKLFISKPVLGRSSGKWSLNMTRRINFPDGSFGGAAVVTVDPFYFTEFYKQMNLGKNTVTSLIGQDGIVRARQVGDQMSIGQDVNGSLSMDALVSSGEGSYISDSVIDGVKRIYSYRKVREYPFVVFVGMDEDEILADFYSRVRGYYQIAALVTGIIFMFIGVLLLMAAYQKRAEKSLRDARDSLESKVELRTQELHGLNQELTAINSEVQEANRELSSEITERKRTEQQLKEKHIELEAAYADLKNAQLQILHQEKMASIGQLAAGVAHEINNPLGFVSSNFETLQKYVARMTEILMGCRALQKKAEDNLDGQLQEEVKAIAKLEKDYKLDYILKDISPLIQETLSGLKRVGDIVKALRLFSRVDQQGKVEDYDINEGVKNSLVVSRNEVKYVAVVEEELSELPTVQAIGGQINQVILNLVLNAAYAIKIKGLNEMGRIGIRTFADENFVTCEVKDNGIGIPEQSRHAVFNPFFTTKPVGEGTGLGLSISYDIIVNKHHGEFSFESREGEGTTFLFKLPLPKNSAD